MRFARGKSETKIHYELGKCNVFSFQIGGGGGARSAVLVELFRIQPVAS